MTTTGDQKPSRKPVIIVVLGILAIFVFAIAGMSRTSDTTTASPAATTAATVDATPTALTPTPTPTTVNCDELQEQANKLAALGSKTPLANTIRRATEAGCTITEPKLQQPKTWYPKGYNLSPNPTVAFKWDKDRPDCYSCTGSAITVVSQHGCPNGLYVEVTFHDAADTIVDWSNDRLPSLDAGQKARLEFVTYNDRARRILLGQVDCR